MLVKIFPSLFPALVVENDKITDALPETLYLLEALLERHKDDITLLHATATLFDMAGPRDLAIQLQLRERKAILARLWECFKSDDRRKRVIVA